jgi:hypothetical protein
MEGRHPQGWRQRIKQGRESAPQLEAEADEMTVVLIALVLIVVLAIISSVMGWKL